MKLICIGHRKPLFNISQPYRMLSPVALDMPNVEVIPDDIWGDAYDGKIISEFLQLFVLSETLDPNNDELIYLFQYRKFLIPQSTRNLSGLTDTGYTCRPDEADWAFPTAHQLASLRRPTTGMVSKVDVAQQYATNHYASDFICFSLALSESGLFTAAEVLQFVRAQYLVVSATLGAYPTSMLVRHLRIIRQIWDIYRQRYYVRREGYQVRVGGYLLERLHSFLILLDGARDASFRLKQWQRVIVVTDR